MVDTYKNFRGVPTLGSRSSFSGPELYRDMGLSDRRIGGNSIPRRDRRFTMTPPEPTFSERVDRLYPKAASLRDRLGDSLSSGIASIGSIFNAEPAARLPLGPRPPISGGPVETDPEKIARIIASRPRKETPSGALSRGDAHAAIFRAGGDPRSERLAAEAGAYLDRTAGATLRGETPTLRLPSGRLVYAAAAPGLSNTRQVDTSARGTVGDQTQGEVFPGAVAAVTRGDGPEAQAERRLARSFARGTQEEVIQSLRQSPTLDAQLAKMGLKRDPPPMEENYTPPPPPAPAPAVEVSRVAPTKQVFKTPIIPGVDPQDDAAMYEDPTGSLSNSNVTGATEIEAAGTKIATTPAEDLNNNEKAIKKGFFENANMGMVEFGLRMASAASKPGATALGAAADAGVAMIDSKALRDAKKADTEFKQAMQKGLIDAKASEGKKDRAERVARATAETNAAFRLQRERLNSTEGISVKELKLKNRQLTALENYQLEKIRVESEGIESTSVNSQRNLIQELVKTSGAIAKANNIAVAGMTPDDAVAARLEMFTSTLQGVVGNSLIYNSLDKELVASYLPPAPTTAPAAGTDPTSVQSRLRAAIAAK